MSQSDHLQSSFVREVRAMINGAKDDIHEIVKVWQLKVMTRLVIETPGPGNQYYLTEYIATGRLRGGWNFGAEAPPGVPLMGITGREDGEDRAQSTISRVGLEITGAGLLPTSFLWNEVGYGAYVHEGIGNHAHIGPRPWVQWVALEADDLLDQARREVMEGRRGE